MKRIKTWSGRVLAGLALVTLVACGDDTGTVQPGGGGAMGRIEGTVFYRERMLLPPGVELEVQLQDISRADAMATVLATVTRQPDGSPPYAFAIEYDPASIDPRKRYALRATISRDDQLLFTSTEYIDPFQGNPVEVMVQRVAEPVQRDSASLEGRRWLLETLAGESAPPGAGEQPVDLQFDGGEMRAAGFSGCNRYTGSYVREGVSEYGNALAFGPTAGTMMACVDGLELERQYLQILGTVTAFRLDGNRLSLLAGPDVVATFTAQ